MSGYNHTSEMFDGFGELLSRESNGIQVSLLWRRADDRAKVSVRDDSTQSSFDLEIGADSPLDVFHHPFAYAAFRHVDVECSFERELAAA